jgi:N-acetylneuraminate synthase
MIITAEIGINHNGDIEIAKKLIDVASNCGCDAVKFQKRTVEKIYSKNTLDSPRESQWGNTTRDQKLGLEFKKEEYDIIDDYCKKKNIIWYASAWDIDSQLFLRKYNLKYNKIASAMLVNHKLLETVAEEQKHTFISTGMSTMEDIEKAVKIFRDHDCPFELQHSNSSYPMKPSESNLRVIQTLSEKFKCNVGYSGHESIGYLICIVAVAFGATSIERHLTLDHTMYGSDQAASLEPEGLRLLVKNLRKIDEVLGDGIKVVWDSELSAQKKLREILC